MRSYKSALLPILVTILLFSSTFIIYWDIEPYYQLQPDSKAEDELGHVHSLSFSESSEEGKCPYCGGTGDCYNCAGTGNCRICWGTGICFSCDGEGGRYVEKFGGGTKWSPCAICHETGICHLCNETGKCVSCDGTGVCPLCHGTKESTATLKGFDFDGGMIESLEGVVKVFYDGKWNEMKIGYLIKPGDIIETGEGSMAMLRLSDGSLLKICENTYFELESSIEQNSIWNWIKIQWGKFWSNLKVDLGIEKEKFLLKTPQAIVAVRGTELSVEVSENGTTFLTVLDGVVEFSDLEYIKNVSVSQYQISTVEPGGVPSDPQSIDPSQIDKWWEFEDEQVIEQNKEKKDRGIPGFEAIAVIAAIAVALIILRRKK